MHEVFLAGARNLIYPTEEWEEKHSEAYLQSLALTFMQWNLDFIPREWRVINEKIRIGMGN